MHFESFEKEERLLEDHLNTEEFFQSLFWLISPIFKKVFEKALDEPKYSSMYAQLCLRLSEEAPNFDDPGKTGNSVSKTKE